MDKRGQKGGTTVVGTDTKGAGGAIPHAAPRAHTMRVALIDCAAVGVQVQRDIGVAGVAVRGVVDADPAGSEPPEGAREEKMNIRQNDFGTGDYYERIVFSGGNNR